MVSPFGRFNCLALVPYSGTQSLMQKDLYQRFLNYAFWLLGRRAYSKNEIIKKFNLKAKKLKLEEGQAGEIKERVLSRLEKLNYINDAKILENYFEYRLTARPAGKYIFLNEMRKRGIDLDVAKTAWASRKIDEEKLAEEFIAGKLEHFKDLDPQKRKKRIAGLLARRGFSADTVWSVLGKAVKK